MNTTTDRYLVSQGMMMKFVLDCTYNQVIECNTKMKQKISTQKTHAFYKFISIYYELKMCKRNVILGCLIKQIILHIMTKKFTNIHQIPNLKKKTSQTSYWKKKKLIRYTVSVIKSPAAK